MGYAADVAEDSFMVCRSTGEKDHDSSTPDRTSLGEDGSVSR